METRSIYPITLEVRGAGRTISGSFPYGVHALRTGRGQTRRETFASRAFAGSIEGRDVSLLSGHEMAKPLASTGAASLTLEDTPEGLNFRAELPEASQQTTWMRDIVAAMAAGLVGGVSPGFLVPVGGEEVIEERGERIRRINRAVLYELSLVHRPAYPATEAELRGDTVDLRRRRIWL